MPPEHDFTNQLRTKTLEGLHTSQARNTDRYLGTATDHAQTLKAKGYPLNAGILKDLENTFATFHEEILSQAIVLMTWGVALEEDWSQTVVLRASEKAFDAARSYAERLAEDEWRRRVTPVVDSNGSRHCHHRRRYRASSLAGIGFFDALKTILRGINRLSVIPPRTGRDYRE